MQELYDRIIQLRASIAVADAKRDQIKVSEEYKAMETAVKECTQAMQVMLDSVPSHELEMQEAKDALFQAMRAAGKDVFENCRIKYETKKKVNSARLFDVLGRDMDTFLSLANVTQKSVQELADENENGIFKRELLGCIEIEKQEAVSVEYKEAKTKVNDQAEMKDLISRARASRSLPTE